MTRSKKFQDAIDSSASWRHRNCAHEARLKYLFKSHGKTCLNWSQVSVMIGRRRRKQWDFSKARGRMSAILRDPKPSEHISQPKEFLNILGVNESQGPDLSARLIISDEEGERPPEKDHTEHGVMLADLSIRMAQHKGQMSTEDYTGFLCHLIAFTAQSMSRQCRCRRIKTTGNLTEYKDFAEHLKALIDIAVNSKFPLQKLPLELRRMIYHHALVRNNPTCDPRNKAPQSDLDSYIALLRTSQNIGAEAADVLYGENNFDLTGGNGWIYLEGFLHSIDDRNMQRLRMVIASVPDWTGTIREDNEKVNGITQFYSKFGIIPVPTPRRDLLLGAFMGSCNALMKLKNLRCVTLNIDVNHVKFWSDQQATDEQKTRKRHVARLHKRFEAEQEILGALVKSIPTVALDITGHRALLLPTTLAKLERKAEGMGIQCKLRRHSAVLHSVGSMM